MGVMGTSLLGTGTAAHAASSKTWKDLAILGGAATVYGLLKHNDTVAIAGGVGTALAYSKYKSAKEDEQRDGYYGYYRNDGYNRDGNNRYNRYDYRPYDSHRDNDRHYRQ